MKINKATVDLVKEFEGFRSEAYLDPVGIWTIGYGTTAEAGLGIAPRPGMRITQKEAETYLMLGLEKFAKRIAPMIKQPITENEFGAFVSLAYNIGPGAFLKSTALQAFNEGKKDKAANAILMWNKATINGVRKVLPGLDRRRKAERELFLRPETKGKPVAAVGLGVLILAAIASLYDEIMAAITSLFGG